MTFTQRVYYLAYLVFGCYS